MRIKNSNSNSHLPDWQQGEHSTLSPLERVELMNEWLKKNNEEIKSKLQEPTDENEIVVGFPD